MSEARELVVWFHEIPDVHVKLGWFTRVPLYLVGYDSGRFAVIYLETLPEGITSQVELVSTR